MGLPDWRCEGSAHRVRSRPAGSGRGRRLRTHLDGQVELRELARAPALVLAPLALGDVLETAAELEAGEASAGVSRASPSAAQLSRRRRRTCVSTAFSSSSPGRIGGTALLMRSRKSFENLRAGRESGCWSACGARATRRRRGERERILTPARPAARPARAEAPQRGPWGQSGSGWTPRGRGRPSGAGRGASAAGAQSGSQVRQRERACRAVGGGRAGAGTNAEVARGRRRGEREDDVPELLVVEPGLEQRVGVARRAELVRSDEGADDESAAGARKRRDARQGQRRGDSRSIGRRRRREGGREGDVSEALGPAGGASGTPDGRTHPEAARRAWLAREVHRVAVRQRLLEERLAGLVCERRRRRARARGEHAELLRQSGSSSSGRGGGEGRGGTADEPTHRRRRATSPDRGRPGSWGCPSTWSSSRRAASWARLPLRPLLRRRTARRAGRSRRPCPRAL